MATIPDPHQRLRPTFRPVTFCHSLKWLEFKLNTGKLRDRAMTEAVFQFLFAHYFSSKKGTNL